MKQSEDTARIRHMLESALEACQFLGDKAFDDFRDNRLFGNAIVRSLEVVGEAASQVTNEYKITHPSIEWRVIISMRNRLIHAYFDIDFWVVWKTVRDDLPGLIEQLRTLLGTEEGLRS